jgi:hypothetical protein
MSPYPLCEIEVFSSKDTQGGIYLFDSSSHQKKLAYIREEKNMMMIQETMPSMSVPLLLRAEAALVALERNLRTLGGSLFGRGLCRGAVEGLDSKVCIRVISRDSREIGSTPVSPLKDLSSVLVAFKFWLRLI